jgi:hypothetical protein
LPAGIFLKGKENKMPPDRDHTNITLNTLQDLFYASGTRVFGGATEESDYDFLVSPKEGKLAWDILRWHNSEREEYDNPTVWSYKFPIKEMTPLINLIAFKKPEVFYAWCFATDKMESFNSTDAMIVNRAERLILFQTFVSIYLKRTP